MIAKAPQAERTMGVKVELRCKADHLPVRVHALTKNHDICQSSNVDSG